MRTGGIDAVVTWVDGTDPVHQRKRQAYMRDVGWGRFHRRAASPTRFADSGEIEFCLRSIRRHAPWVHRIFLVTDEQVPEGLGPGRRQELGVTLIDHRDIFRGYEEFLPTFNSLSIETMIHRIPELSEHFLYLNDDVLLVADIEAADYFDAGKPLLRGAWSPERRTLWERMRRRKKGGARGLVGRRNEEKWLPIRDRVFRLAHAPYPLRRSVLEEVCDERAMVFNARYRFRHADQFWPIALAANRCLLSGEAAVGPSDWLYLDFNKNPSSEEVAGVLDAAESGRDALSLCVQSLDQADDEHARRVRECLDRVT